MVTGALPSEHSQQVFGRLFAYKVLDVAQSIHENAGPVSYNLDSTRDPIPELDLLVSILKTDQSSKTYSFRNAKHFKILLN